MVQSAYGLSLWRSPFRKGVVHVVTYTDLFAYTLVIIEVVTLCILCAKK